MGAGTVRIVAIPVRLPLLAACYLLASLYEGLACQEVFSRSTFASSYVSRVLTRARFCIDGTAASCLAAPSGQPLSPEGRAGRREGLTANGARRVTMVSRPLRCKSNCVSGDPLCPVTFWYVCSINPRLEPFRYAALAASTYIRYGPSPYQGPSCNSARALGSKGDGTILVCGVSHHARLPVTHPPWIR